MGKRTSRREIPEALYCDAGYLIAYFAPNDQYHQRALKIRKHLGQKPVKLFSSWPTIAEASTLLLFHYGYRFASALLEALPAFQLIMPIETEYREAENLFHKFNRDKKLSFNDLLTYALIRIRLKDIPVLAFDRDLAKIGLTIFTP